MANDDHRDDPIPEPDAPVSELERERAASFGDLIDGLLDGATSPPAMPADERALMEVAAVVNTVAGQSKRAELRSERRDALIEAALAQAVAAPAKPSDASKPPTSDAELPPGVTSLASRRVRRAAPWLITAVAAAAAAFFALRPPRRTAAPQTAKTITAPATRLSTDQLVGRIPRREAGNASSRIDLIYHDRLALYRRGRLGGTR